MTGKRIGGELDTENFYYKGKWFNTPEEMFEYAKEWNQTCISEESLNQIFKCLKKDILFNMGLFNFKINNSDLIEITESLFLEIMKLRVNE